MINRQYKIAIIGAGYLQLPLVEKAKEMGLETHCFAHENGAICRGFCTKFYPISILEKEKIAQVCKEIEIDGVLTIASDVAVPTVSYIAKKNNLIANSLASSLVCTNKYLMKEVLESAGVKVAKFQSVKSESDLGKVVSFQYPIMVKPVDRSGSLGVTKIESINDLKSAFNYALDYSFSKEVIIEEFIEGSEISVESISIENSHYVLAITDKVTTGAPHFVELEHHQPSGVDVRIKEDAYKITLKSLDALGIKTGASHTELIISKKGVVCLNEVGARMGGDFIGSHLVSLSTGYDFLKGTINTALGVNEIPILRANNFSGVIFCNDENKINFENLESKTSTIIEYKKQTKEIKPLTKSSDRNGYLIYQSNKRINFE